jgi:hypothetical protein
MYEGSSSAAIGSTVKEPSPKGIFVVAAQKVGNCYVKGIGITHILQGHEEYTIYIFSVAYFAL